MGLFFSKPAGDKLIEALGNLIPEEQVESIRQQGNDVAKNKLGNLEQLRNRIDRLVPPDQSDKVEKAFKKYQKAAKRHPGLFCYIHYCLTRIIINP